MTDSKIEVFNNTMAHLVVNMVSMVRQHPQRSYYLRRRTKRRLRFVQNHSLDYRQYYYNKYEKTWKAMVRSEGMDRVIRKDCLEDTITKINRIRTVLETDGSDIDDLNMVYYACLEIENQPKSFL
ncbi:hypothetical protein ILUMI_23278 [Ignelater luminosus]|uniref:Uncharacterized protein n=1 Tax=Ignelater luminosus TaxID=2038154 RepID=A0A8K0CEX7_IGNLU|nr:hypothetical protein ILUMI_23278 [Ignelater luminosus]